MRGNTELSLYIYDNEHESSTFAVYKYLERF